MSKELHRLLDELPGQDWWSRQELIDGLLSYPEEDYLEYLERGLRNHEDADVRNAAMEVYRALGRRGFSSLARLLNDRDHEVRLFAVNILCGIDEEETFTLLASALRDADVTVRAAAAEGLGRSGGVPAVGLLGEVLDDDPWVSMAAIHALGDIGGEEALDLLLKCMQAGRCREFAIPVIERAGNKECIGHLVACLHEPGIRRPALRAVVKIAEREQVRPHPEYFIGLIPTLLNMVDSPDPETKRLALVALCWARDISALLPMIEAVKDEELQEHAIEGLLNIGRKAVCGIVDAIKGSTGPHRVVLAKILSMIGENKALLQFASDEDPEVRTEVALALGSLDMERAVRMLTQMLSDRCQEVREAALKSLVRLHNDGLI